MKLTYRTRGESSPQGKPRIYFTGHPADLPICSEEIFADILEMQNCAIYYDEEPEAPYDTEELFRELEQMQLIVIPVTSRFLYQENRALAVEFPFAARRHIPVLPLVQEPNLEASFNEKCGDLQMLNKHDPDPTALPYADKLEKFLSSVLVGDELAEKVRAAFDAYVFLSYRKKDRRYARELMQLIHRNEFCRDIAIWYDEFLTPGENFNEAIAEALQKCALFTLAVTPNIVEPGNYVVRQEYPEAKKSGKPILPVELVPTDKAALENSFQDIPPCTDAYDESALSVTLLKAVQKLAIRENDGSPEHNFFIGLAYLSGIDVEVDRPRALSLITGAAENELPEAMEKLVSMYRSGDGVERNYHTAIQWQERIVDWRRRQFEESRSADDLLSLANALWDLGDYQRELDDVAAAKQTYQQMLDISKPFAEQYHAGWAWKYVSACYGFLGNICLSEADLKGAESYYLQALEIARLLCGKTDDANMRRDLAVCYVNLGNISRAEGDLEKAKNYYLQELKLSTQLYEEYGNVKERRALFVSCSNLGIISQAMAELTDARDYYLQALDLSRQLWEETGTAQAQEDLATACTQLGDLSRRERRPADAKDYYLQALDLRRQLCEETGTVDARRNLSFSYNRLGEISWDEKQLSDVENYYMQALKLRRQLWEETGTIQAGRELATSYERLGTVKEEEKALSEAKHLYLQALKLRRQLCEEAQTGQIRNELSSTYQMLQILSDSYKKLCLSCQDKGELIQAKELCLQDLDLDRLLYEETGAREAQRELSVCYTNLGDISQAVNESDAAEDYYRQGFELSRQLCEKKGTRQARRDLSVSYHKLGNISWNKGLLAEAEDYYLKALALNGPVWKEEEAELQNPLLCTQKMKKEARETQCSLTASYTGLIRLALADGSLYKAKEYFLHSLEASEQLYRETTISAVGASDISTRELAVIKDCYLLGLEVSKQLYEASGTLEMRTELAAGYHRLGNVSQKEKHFSEAESYYRQSLELNRKSYEETGSAEIRRRLADDHGRMGDVLRAEGKSTGAGEHYLCELKINKQLYEETGTEQAQRYLSLNYGRLRKLAHSYDRLGKTCENEGDLIRAEESYLQYAELSRLVSREMWDLENRQDPVTGSSLFCSKKFLRERTEVQQELIAAYNGLGRIALAAGRLEKAKDYYLKALKESERLYEQAGPAPAQRLIAASYKRLAGVSRTEGNLAEAEEYDRQAAAPGR